MSVSLSLLAVVTVVSYGIQMALIYVYSMSHNLYIVVTRIVPHGLYNLVVSGSVQFTYSF